MSPMAAAIKQKRSQVNRTKKHKKLALVLSFMSGVYSLINSSRISKSSLGKFTARRFYVMCIVFAYRFDSSAVYICSMSITYTLQNICFFGREP